MVKLDFQQQHKRDLVDSVEDTILLLYLLDKVGGKIIGEDDYFQAKIKLMKLVFLSELETFKAKEKGFNFFYNTYKRGPCSQEVLAILDDLEKVDLITSDYKENSIGLTNRGREIIHSFLEDQGLRVQSNNKHIIEKIDKVIEKYGNLTTEQLLKKVYAMEIELSSGKKVNVGEAVKNFEKSGGKEKPRFLMRVSKFKRRFVVSPEWVETFNVLCNPKFKDIVDACHV